MHLFSNLTISISLIGDILSLNVIGNDDKSFILIKSPLFSLRKTKSILLEVTYSLSFRLLVPLSFSQLIKVVIISVNKARNY